MGERRRGPGSRGHRTRTSRREASARGLLELSPLALWRRLVDRLDEAYWPTPAACVALGAALSFALVQVDRGLARRGITVAFTGASDSALSLLSTIASSMLTLTALVFTITIVVLQLASTQFSPRALRTFLRDRQNQLTLGLFLATFVYALVALREVRGRGGAVEEFIPGLTITGSFALVLVSVVVFVHYIHHIAQSIRAVTIVERIGDETRATIAHLHPDEGSEEVLEQGEDEGARGAGGDVVVEAEAPGVVASVDVARLVEVATTTGVTARLVPWVRSSRPTYCTTQPLNVIGKARKRCRARASRNPHRGKNRLRPSRCPNPRAGLRWSGLRRLGPSCPGPRAAPAPCRPGHPGHPGGQTMASMWSVRWVRTKQVLPVCHRPVDVRADLVRPALILHQGGEHGLDRRVLAGDHGMHLVDDQLPPHERRAGGPRRRDLMASRAPLESDDGLEPVPSVGVAVKPSHRRESAWRTHVSKETAGR